MELNFFDEGKSNRAYSGREEQWDELMAFADMLLVELLQREPTADGFMRPRGIAIDLAAVPEALIERVPPTKESFSERFAYAAIRANDHIRGRSAATRDLSLLTFEFIAQSYELTPVARIALLFALCPCFDMKYEKVFALLGGVASGAPTIGSVLAAYGLLEKKKAGLEEFLAQAKALRLIFEEPEGGFAHMGIATQLLPCEEIVRAAMGDLGISRKLSAFTELIQWGGKMEEPIYNRSLPEELVKVIENEDSAEHRGPRAMMLKGVSGSGRLFVLCHAMRQKKLDLLVINMNMLPDCDDAKLSDLLLSIEREFSLKPMLICLRNCGVGEAGNSAETERRIIDGIATFSPFFWITAPVQGSAAARESRVEIDEIEVSSPGYDDTAELFRRYSDGYSFEHGSSLEEQASWYRLMPNEVRKVLELAQLEACRRGVKEISTADISEGLRGCRSRSMSTLGEVIPARYTYDDLVTTQYNQDILQLAAAHIKFRGTVRERWGMDKKNVYGRGICVLFYGPPGTGKTMAAQALARDVGMDLFRVDASQLTSKYIGETSKNLSEVFEEARGNNIILFFDEADAIFGKRSEGNDANDRYANNDTAFLLQKIEGYEGMVILATNLLNNIDDAFRRRVTYMVNLSTPNRELREKIWRSIIPKEMPVEKLDFEFLSKFELAGSGIKSILISAAYLAAVDNKPVGMAHILKSLQIFMAKTGKQLLKSDLFPYEDLVEL